MNNETKYKDLQEKLAKLEKEHNVYLADPCIDLENVEWKPTSSNFTDEQYADLYSAACSAAGSRAEEAGLDINKLIGKVIY